MHNFTSSYMDKLKLREAIMAMVVQKQENLKFDITQAQESLAVETKSSSGDKHETARAKMQIEIEKLSNQLADLENQLVQLQKIDFGAICQRAQLGAIVSTDKGFFVLAIALGKINFENNTVYSISLASPLGLQLLGKQVGQSFSLNGVSYLIKAIQ